MTKDILKQLEEITSEVKRVAKSKPFCPGRFLPNTTVVFVAEMPSSKKKLWNLNNNFFISKTDKCFVDILNRNGLGGSYITDIVKTCSKARRPTKAEINNFKDVLLREVAVIKPKLVVALGESAFQILSDADFKQGIPFKIYKSFVWHPANLRYKKRQLVIKRQVKKLAEFCQ